jgi:predicted proteasome-type protease
MIPIILSLKSETENEEYIQRYVKEKKIKLINIIIISPDKTEISLDQIRNLKKDLLVQSPTQRVIVIKEFDSSSLEVQNSLLKIIEEKSEENQFFFLVENIHRLVPTIVSRSRVVASQPNRTLSLGSKDFDNLIKKISEGQLKNLLATDGLQKITREKAETLFLKLLEYCQGKVRLGSLKEALIAKEVIRVKSLVENNNVNPQLAVDHVLIFIMRTYTMN